jgi:hypothetical protein
LTNEHLSLIKDNVAKIIISGGGFIVTEPILISPGDQQTSLVWGNQLWAGNIFTDQTYDLDSTNPIPPSYLNNNVSTVNGGVKVNVQLVIDWASKPINYTVPSNLTNPFNVFSYDYYVGKTTLTVRSV